MDRPLFIIRRGDRLAARTKVILHTWRFARKVGGQVVVSWPPRDRSIFNALEAEYYSPFSIWNLPKFYAEGGYQELFFMEGDYRVQDFPSLKDPEWEGVRPNKFRPEQFEGKNLVFLDDQFPYIFEGETYPGIREELRALYRRLPVETQVGIWLDEARRAIGTDDYVVLHMRRGDIIGVLQNAIDHIRKGQLTNIIKGYANNAAMRTAPHHFYYPFIERALARQAKIVFFSDSPETLDHFADKYGAEKFLRGQDLAPDCKYKLQKAYIDFRLISEAREIIGTSTGFTNVASMIGNNISYNAACSRPLEEFVAYFFNEVLMGEPLSDAIKNELVAVFSQKYQINLAQSIKRRGEILNPD